MLKENDEISKMVIGIYINRVSIPKYYESSIIRKEL